MRLFPPLVALVLSSVLQAQAVDKFVVTQKHTVKHQPSNIKPQPTPDPEPLPNPTPTPNVDPIDPPKPSGCQCGCGRRVCHCGRAGSGVGCPPVDISWISGVGSIEPQKEVSGSMTIEAFSSKTCSACPAYKSNIPDGTFRNGFTVRWRDDKIPDHYEASLYYPAFYLDGKLLVQSSEFGGVQYSEILNRLVSAASKINSEISRIEVASVVWGSLNGKVNIDNTISWWGSTFGVKGTHTLPTLAQKKFVVEGAAVELPSNPQISWDFSGPNKALKFLTKPRLTIYRMVGVSLSGIRYDGKQLSLEVDGFVDPTFSVVE